MQVRHRFRTRLEIVCALGIPLYFGYPVERDLDMTVRVTIPTIIAAALCCGTAHAELELEWGGRLQSDVRFRIQEKSVGDFYDRRRLPVGIDRNENIFKLKLGAYAGRFQGIVDVDFVWLGRSPDIDVLSDLSDRRVVERHRVEAQSVYIEANDLFFEGLDLRVGQQIVSWGVGDQFNPTNNLNSEDLEDPLLFGQQQANLMAKVDYTLGDAFTVSGVLVPVFRAALLPTSGQLAIAAVDRLPHIDEALRHRIHVESAVSETALFDTLGPDLGARFPARVESVRTVVPENSLKNMQWAFRLATTVAEQDVALSYYNGREDFPLPIQNVTRQQSGLQCDPQDPSRCIDGTLDTTVTLSYPEVQVVGLNLAGEMNLLGWIDKDIPPIGYRLELGVYFPQEQRLIMRQGEIVIGNITQPAGEYDYRADQPPLVLRDTPFAKWAVGLDYTFGGLVYVNLQWVHGLVDEFGAGDFLTEGYAVRDGGVSTDADATIGCFFDRDYERCARELLRPKLGDYIVLGTDINFASNDGLFRLFAIFDATPTIEEKYSRTRGERVQTTFSPFSAEGFSMVLYPQLSYNFGDGLELSGGGLIQLGKPYTKFGDPGAGGSLIWTRARFSF